MESAPVPNAKYVFTVKGDDQALANSSATAFADVVREAEGVLNVDRAKAADASTMDLGAIISVVATSGATLAIAQGISAWLRARRGVALTVEKDRQSDSVKAAVTGIDPEVAMRIVEMIREA
jgi:Effector Associated Constant Component 1